MNPKDEASRTKARRDEHEMDDQALDAVNGGILSTGHTTRAGTRGGTTKDDSGRRTSGDRGGKIIWQDIDSV